MSSSSGLQGRMPQSSPRNPQSEALLELLGVPYNLDPDLQPGPPPGLVPGAHPSPPPPPPAGAQCVALKS